MTGRPLLGREYVGTPFALPVLPLVVDPPTDPRGTAVPAPLRAPEYPPRDEPVEPLGRAPPEDPPLPDRAPPDGDAPLACDPPPPPDDEPPPACDPPPEEEPPPLDACPPPELPPDCVC